MLSSSLASYLPPEIKPEDWDELFLLKAGLGGSFGETRFILSDDTLAALTRSSSIGKLDLLELDPDHLPRIKKQKWKVTLTLTTKDGETHEFSLSHDERGRAGQALETYFVAREAWSELADLLETRIEATTGSERNDLLLRLGRIRLDRLDDPEGAYRCFNDILTQRSDHEEALEGMEGLFFRGHMEEKIGPVLEARFRRRADHEKLALLLTQMAPLKAKPEERAAAWLEAAKIRDSRQRDPEGALLNAGKALAETPTDRSVVQTFDDLAAKTGRWSEARDYLRASLKGDLSPEAREILLRKIAAISEERLGDLDAAAAALRELLEIDPKDLDAWKGLDRIFQAQERWAELVSVLETSIDLLPPTSDQTDLIYRLGEVLAEHLDDRDRAQQCFEKVIGRLTYHRESFEWLETIHTEREDWTDLLELLDRWRSQETDEAVLNRLLASLGYVHHQLGNDEQAIESLRQLLTLDPDNQEALNTLLELHTKRKDWGEAVEVLVRQAEIAAEADRKARRYRAAALTARDKLEDSKRALKLFLKSHEVKAGDREVLRAIRQLAVALRRDDALVRALSGLLAIRDLPDDERDDSRIELARTLQKLGRTEEAIEVWKRILEDRPRDKIALDTVIELYRQLDRWGDAVETIRSVVPKIPDQQRQVELLMQAADIQSSRQDDLGAAAETYIEVLKIIPEHRETLERVEEIYRSRQDWEGLVEFYELRAEAAGEGKEGLNHLIAAAEVTARNLRRPERALNTLLPQIKQHWRSEELARALGRIAAKTELWPDALRAMEKRYHTLKNADDLKVFGARIDQMIEELNEHLDQRQRDGELYLDLALHYTTMREDPDRAADFYRRAMHDPNTKAAALEGLRGALVMSQDWHGLIELLEQRVLADGVSESDRRDMYGDLALAYDSIGDHERAEAARSKAKGGSSRLPWLIAVAVFVIAIIVYYLRFSQ